jgi:hypothetical protein
MEKLLQISRRAFFFSVENPTGCSKDQAQFTDASSRCWVTTTPRRSLDPCRVLSNDESRSTPFVDTSCPKMIEHFHLDPKNDQQSTPFFFQSFLFYLQFLFSGCVSNRRHFSSSYFEERRSIACCQKIVCDTSSHEEWPTANIGE